MGKIIFFGFFHKYSTCYCIMWNDLYRLITDIIFCKQYWELVAIQVTTNTMTTSAHRLILIAPYKSRRVKDMKKLIYYF